MITRYRGKCPRCPGRDEVFSRLDSHLQRSHGLSLQVAQREALGTKQPSFNIKPAQKPATWRDALREMWYGYLAVLMISVVLAIELGLRALLAIPVGLFVVTWLWVDQTRILIPSLIETTSHDIKLVWEYWDKRYVRELPFHKFFFNGKRIVAVDRTASSILFNPHNAPVPEVKPGDFASYTEHADSTWLMRNRPKSLTRELIKYGSYAILVIGSGIFVYFVWQTAASYVPSNA